MWIEELSNGKYKCNERYTDYITGKTKKVSVTIDKNTRATRKVAEETLRLKIVAKLDADIPKDITLEYLVSEYLKYQVKEVKGSTLNRNTSVCNSFIHIFGADTIVTRYTAPYVRKKFNDTGQKGSTLNERLKRFKAMIRWGYKNDYLDDIKFIDKIENFKEDEPIEDIEEKFLEADELSLLISEMRIEKWKLLTQFLALTGIRIGEAIALESNDIDLTKRIIHVTKNYDAGNKLVTTPKSKSSTRDVYIQDELILIIKQLSICMKRQRLMHGYSKTPLFLSDDKGSHIHYAAYAKYIKENAQRVLNRDHVTPHVLRHTHTSLLAENGVSLDAISRRLGHEDSRITKAVYLHITKRMKERDNEEIAKVKIF